MEKKNYFLKGAVFAVILSFFGLAIIPSINANTSKTSSDNDLVEITIKVFGISGFKPQKVKLTKQQVNEVEQLFDTVNNKLNTTSSREEAIVIFNEAVVELDKYRLLGGLSVQQAKSLLTGNTRNKDILYKIQNGLSSIFNNGQTQIIFPNYVNVFCLFSATAVPDPYWVNIPPFITVLGPYLLLALGPAWLFLKLGLKDLANQWAFIILEKGLSNPFKFINIIFSYDYFYDISSFGLNGRVKKISYLDPWITGFTGLMLYESENKINFLGFALGID